MPHRMLAPLCLAVVALAPIQVRPASAAEPDPAKRLVLVELFTSQGCDMCPKAEEILGDLARREPGIVPVALHVDYFNNPWRDIFSEPIYSQRQMTYHQVYTKPKPADYGLYYTPMLMIDGEQSVNGRDPGAAQSAIRSAMAKRPGVTLQTQVKVADDGKTGSVRIHLTARNEKAENAPLLIAAVLREDGVRTAIESGENRGKTLVARFPARQMKYDFLTLRGKTPEDQEFRFTLDPSWKPEALRLAVFAQDKRTGAVHQAVDLPWATTPESGGKTARR